MLNTVYKMMEKAVALLMLILQNASSTVQCFSCTSLSTVGVCCVASPSSAIHIQPNWKGQNHQRAFIPRTSMACNLAVFDRRQKVPCFLFTTNQTFFLSVVKESADKVIVVFLGRSEFVNQRFLLKS